MHEPCAGPDLARWIGRLLGVQDAGQVCSSSGVVKTGGAGGAIGRVVRLYPWLLPIVTL